MNDDWFKKPRLILVEGVGELYLFIELLKYLKNDEIEVREYGGINSIGKFLKSMKVQRSFRQNVRVIGILRDCERDRYAGFQSLQSALNNAGLPAPNAEDTFDHNNEMAVIARLIPVGTNEGCLEDILIESSHDEALNFAKEYVEKLEAENYSLNEKKALIHAYLASKPEPYKLIGSAAKCNYWDFEDPAFAQLIDFINTIASRAL